MNGTTVVAAILLIGAFGFTIYALHHSGVDAALKVWGAMGTISGAIISFYFTNSYNQREIQQANLQRDTAVLALNSAAQKAADARDAVAHWANILETAQTARGESAASKGISSMPEQERAEWADKLKKASTKLNDIDVLTVKINQEHELRK